MKTLDNCVGAAELLGPGLKSHGHVELNALPIRGRFDRRRPVRLAGHADEKHDRSGRALFDVQLLKRRARRPCFVGATFKRREGGRPAARGVVAHFDAVRNSVAVVKEHDTDAVGFERGFGGRQR